LVNSEGQVIGVTSAIESPVRANAGIGFAIPSAIVQQVVPALVANGRYEHTWIGIKGTTLTADLNTAMKLSSDQRGVLVMEVTSGSPAEQAGLKAGTSQATIQGQQVNVGGDVIVAIDGQPVKTFEDVVAYLAGHTTVGQKITLSVLRQGKGESVQLTLAARPQQPVTAQQPQQVQPRGQRGTTTANWLGVVGATLTADIAQAMNLPADQSGILVQQVVTGSPAEQAGLRASTKSVVINGQSVMVGGDVIVAANGQPTARMQDLRAMLQRAQPGQEMTLGILRDGSQVQVSVKLAERPAQPSSPN
jgi:S1-C subfamily serine protease